MADVHPVLPGCPDEELWSLCSAMCDGTIDRRGLARLEDMVQSDPAKQLFVAAYMRMNGRLMRVFRPRVSDGGSPPFDVAATAGSTSVEAAAVGAADEFVGAAVELPHQLAPASPHPPIPASPLILSPLPPSLSTTHYPLPTPFVGGPVFSYIAATLILGVMMLGAWAYKISHGYDPSLTHNSPYAKNSRGSTTPGLSTPQRPDPIFVGRITGMKDCRWSDPATETYAGAYVPLGRKYALASGLMEITYLSGAKVILEGPCSYEVESAAGGFLALGKLTARVESEKQRPKPQALRPKTEISKSPKLQLSKFTVRTPTAVITDLGTEFGVEVSTDGNTLSYVFLGMVRVRVLSDRGRREEALLGANESARVEKGGGAGDHRLILNVLPARLPMFIRRLQMLDPSDFVDGSVFHDDFDGAALAPEKWTSETKEGGTIYVSGGEATIHSPTPIHGLAWMTNSVPLDFSISPNDWWAEVKFKINGPLTTQANPQFPRNWIVLGGVKDSSAKWEMRGFDIRVTRQGEDDGDLFSLGWWGWDTEDESRTPQTLVSNLKKGRYYVVRIHRRSDDKADVYLNDVRVASLPLIAANNPNVLLCGDRSFWADGTIIIDYVKLGQIIPGGKESKTMEQ